MDIHEPWVSWMSCLADPLDGAWWREKARQEHEAASQRTPLSTHKGRFPSPATQTRSCRCPGEPAHQGAALRGVGSTSHVHHLEQAHPRRHRAAASLISLGVLLCEREKHRIGLVGTPRSGLSVSCVSPPCNGQSSHCSASLPTRTSRDTSATPGVLQVRDTTSIRSLHRYED
ncbi:hypothetical protein CALCODRAFT_66760 [Calocera cornea HHB12733]|uniref:Uncharacterized protein n=1 Tax=Calocera cornea HHB12733 TaxID=1353952 RepID=A0A165DJY6_9BASI|nr:hypothetical protein CALCODRAFT_66760 [Calocera cornea HHB12733]